MSTIAYRAGELAADMGAVQNGNMDAIMRKIAKRGSLLAGASGAAPQAQAFLDWFERGCAGAEPPDLTNRGDSQHAHAECFIIMPDNLVLLWTKYGWERLRQRHGFMAFGSGGDIAFGAMLMGATAQQAVRAAAQLDVNTSLEMTVLRRNRLKGRA
jgi:ATP-dependent protease HslVU (ClpYQ) peptidase subunit